MRNFENLPVVLGLTARHLPVTFGLTIQRLKKFRCCAAFCSLRAHAHTGRLKVLAQRFYAQQLTANAESRRYVKRSRNVLRGAL